jgi:hypothetical protein
VKRSSKSQCHIQQESEILIEDVLTQRDEAIWNAACIALAVDESTNMSDNA